MVNERMINQTEESDQTLETSIDDVWHDLKRINRKINAFQSSVDLMGEEIIELSIAARKKETTLIALGKLNRSKDLLVSYAENT